ncbi:MAG: sulfite exporter TauE/SafE family protein [Sulfurimonas sp.]|nr:sulfite exporter TauE/SafE family protein [Sulfurimonas sp.]
MSLFKSIKAFLGGGIIGVLGGLIGLGGAEFRLPMLIGFFHFTALKAIILNKTMSLIVVAFALPFRLDSIPISTLMENSNIIVTMLFGSVFGAWFGAGWATKLKSHMLYKVISILLLMICVILFFGHDISSKVPLFDNNLYSIFAGVISGIAIGIVAALLGVAGGELYIPTIILLFGVDIKLAGSLSLVISLPTMLVAFFRYSKDQSFEVIYSLKSFIIIMGIGSVVGAFIGSRLLGVISSEVLIPFLCFILLIAAYKIYNHK